MKCVEGSIKKIEIENSNLNINGGYTQKRCWKSFLRRFFKSVLKSLFYFNKYHHIFFYDSFGITNVGIMSLKHFFKPKTLSYVRTISHLLIRCMMVIFQMCLVCLKIFENIITSTANAFPHLISTPSYRNILYRNLVKKMRFFSECFLKNHTKYEVLTFLT